MFGSSDSRRAQLWRNETKARNLLDRHGEDAHGMVREAIREAGFNLKVRWHWRRIEQHLQQLKNRSGANL